MNFEIDFTKPKVYHFDYDLKKNWFVGFELTNLSSKEKIRKQFRGGINYYKTKPERLRAANALRDYWQKELENGQFNPFHQSESISHPKNLKESIERIIKLKSTSMKPKSIRNYKDITRWFLGFCKINKFDELPLNQLPKNLGRMYTDYLLTERELSGTSHNNQMGILKTLFNNMKADGREWISFNPFTNIAALPRGIGNNIAYSETERKLLRDFLYRYDKRVYFCTQFTFHCFIRKTELTTIKVGDIDWENKTIKINAKSAKNRIQDSVTIPEGLMDILKEMDLKSYPPGNFIFGKSLETVAERCPRPDDISDRHLKIKRMIIEQNNQTTLEISDGKTYYSWKHSGVVAYWPVVKDIYFMMRQLRHHDLATTMVYLKSLGLMPNELFLNAKIVL